MLPSHARSVLHSVEILVVCAHENGLADVTTLHPVSQLFDAKEMAEGETHLMYDLGRLCCSDHFLCLCDSEGERLFAEHMLTMLDRNQGVPAMHVVGRADRNGVHLIGRT